VVPFALLRNSDFQFKAKSKISKQVGEFLAAGGRTVVIEERQLPRSTPRASSPRPTRRRSTL